MLGDNRLDNFHRGRIYVPLSFLGEFPRLFAAHFSVFVNRESSFNVSNLKMSHVLVRALLERVGGWERLVDSITTAGGPWLEGERRRRFCASWFVDKSRPCTAHRRKQNSSRVSSGFPGRVWVRARNTPLPPPPPFLRRARSKASEYSYINSQIIAYILLKNVEFGIHQGSFEGLDNMSAKDLPRTPAKSRWARFHSPI